MEEKKPKKQKYKGVKGSNSQDQCKARQEIGMQIIEEHNFKITKDAFKKEYEQKIARTSGLKVVTERTWDRDYAPIKELIAEKHKIDFEFTPTAKSRKRKTFAMVPHVDPFLSMAKNLFQIRIVIGDYQTILFSKTKNTFTERDFTHNSLEAISKNYEKVQEDYMVHLYLIYDTNAPHGIETTYCSIYESAGKDNKYYLLYTDAKNHCSEIVCSYDNLPQVLDFTFLLFNRYWRTQV